MARRKIGNSHTTICVTWEDKEKKVKEHRYNFCKFFQEHDKRRGTDFVKTFPELESFYRDCLEIKL